MYELHSQVLALCLWLETGLYQNWGDKIYIPITLACEKHSLSSRAGSRLTRYEISLHLSDVRKRFTLLRMKYPLTLVKRLR